MVDVVRIWRGAAAAAVVSVVAACGAGGTLEQQRDETAVGSMGQREGGEQQTRGGLVPSAYSGPKVTVADLNPYGPDGGSATVCGIFPVEEVAALTGYPLVEAKETVSSCQYSSSGDLIESMTTFVIYSATITVTDVTLYDRERTLPPQADVSADEMTEEELSDLPGDTFYRCFEKNEDEKATGDMCMLYHRAGEHTVSIGSAAVGVGEDATERLSRDDLIEVYLEIARRLDERVV